MKHSPLDWYLLAVVLILLAFGVLMVYDASSSSALRDFGDKYYFLKDQLKWSLLGIAGMVGASFFNYRRFYKLSPLILIGSLALLALVFIPGFGIRAYGAHRWINLHFFVLQPSEFAKLALIIYLSAWFANREKGRLLPFVVLLVIFVTLILLEPDMGTAIILSGMGLIMYFLSEAPLWHGLALLPFAGVGAFLLILRSSYRLKRLTTFLDPSADPLGASYHIRQVLIALGSGGLLGLGLGNSRQKYSYLPEATTDSIFAIIGEELGFIGAIILLAAFAFVFLRGFRIALKAGDKFGKLLAAGIVSWLALQTIVNLGSMVAIIPLTGVPLPFVSYGGSALVTEMVAVGILLNISKNKA